MSLIQDSCILASLCILGDLVAMINGCYCYQVLGFILLVLRTEPSTSYESSNYVFKF